MSFGKNAFGLAIVFGIVISTSASVALAEEKTATPTDAEQVAGIQKMCADSAAAIQARQAKKSLYNRLGERTKIKTLADKIITAHMKNAKIGHFFAHIDKSKVVKNVEDFLVMGTGGKADYKGKDMGSAHKGMNITNGDFLAAGGDVKSVMAEMKYGENEIQEIVCALTSFVPAVVVK